MFLFNDKEKIKKFLVSVGADKTPHIKSGTLYDHVLRVSALLEVWGLDQRVVYASMCHSLYSTDIFKKVVLTIDRRDELRAVIGAEAEALVFIFCSLDRETLTRQGNEAHFRSRFSSKTEHLSPQQAADIVHLLLANDIDHLNVFNVQSQSSYYRKYLVWQDVLSENARDYLALCVTPVASSQEKDSVTFIAHAGAHIKTKDIGISIDPWLYPSSREQPGLQGFDPSSFTIDYLIPEPRNTIKDIESDIILLSHFHTHHAPLREIKELISMRRVDIVCPPLPQDKLTRLEQVLGSELFQKITFHFIAQDTVLMLRGQEIHCLSHSHWGHLAFFVKTSMTSVLHIADAAASASFASLMFDPFWEKYYNLRPEFFFVGAAGHNVRDINSLGERSIIENTTLTPVQAAKLACKVKPKHVGIVGVYNFSVWDNRVEYARTYEAAESEFYWAMSFLAPGIKVHQFRPGDRFIAGE